MEDLIRQVIAMDDSLRARVAEAETRLRTLQEADTAQDEARRQAQAQAGHEAVQIVERAKERAGEEALKADAQHAQAMETLRQLYAQHHTEWVRTLVDRCLSSEAAQ